MLLIFYFPVLSCANTVLLKLELHAEEVLFLLLFFFFSCCILQAVQSEICKLDFQCSGDFMVILHPVRYFSLCRNNCLDIEPSIYSN